MLYGCIRNCYFALVLLQRVNEWDRQEKFYHYVTLRLNISFECFDLKLGSAKNDRVYCD